MTLRADLNCDLGEGAPNDAELLELVTSANIACGVHAGSPELMRRTLELAAARGAGLGAHPGLADRRGMGRAEAVLTPREASALVTSQVEALADLARAVGLRLHHVKPHGALYNMAARDPELAAAVAEAVRAAGPGLALFALAGSELARAGRAAGLAVAEEAFADRGYRSDGSLVPRGGPGALIDDPELAAERALRLVTGGTLAAVDGTELQVRADTICIHGDGPQAPAIARRLRTALTASGVLVRRFNEP